MSAHPRLRSRSGQALLEMAIFGMAALAALGLLIRVGMEMNYNQEVRMGAFRRALAAAASDNDTDEDAMAVAYHYILHRQMPNPSDGYISMPRNRTEASAFAEWGDRLTFAYEVNNDKTKGRKTQPLYVVRSDGAMRTFRQQDWPHDSGNAKAFRGFVTASTTSNNVSGSIAQSGSGSSGNSSTGTSSSTTLGNGDGIGSSVGSSNGVGW